MVVSAIIIVIIIQTLYGENFMPITLFHCHNAFKLKKRILKQKNLVIIVVFSVIVIVITLYGEKFMLITLFQLS